MTLAELRELLDSGRFHHAIYRNCAKWDDGLHIYEKDPNKFQEYRYVGAIYWNDPHLAEAEKMVMGSRGIEG